MGMTFKELELQRMEDDLAVLERDYKTVSEQLRLEGDGPRQNQLTDQLAMIGQKMESLQDKTQRLRQEMQEVRNHLNALVNVLQQHEPLFQEMLVVYQRVLTNWRCPVKSNLQSLTEIVVELRRIPQGRSPYAALDQFVGDLVRSISDATLVDALQDWGEMHIP